MPSAGTAADFALFLDFDGTLVEIAARPDAIVVDPALPPLLHGLSGWLGGALAIVTGRTIADVASYLPDVPADLCGLHGLERRIGGRLVPPEDLRPLTSEVEALRRRLAGVAGIVIEDKSVGVAVHWRMAPEAEGEARAAVGDLAARLGPAYRVQDGKAVQEIVPAGAGKGHAIRLTMGEPPYRGRTPVFIGDDATDEHGFAAVNGAGGIAVKIGPGATAARHRIASPAELRRLLSAWLEGGADPSEWPLSP